MQNLKQNGATVIEFHFFNRIKKNNITLFIYTHTTSKDFKFLLGVILMVWIFTFMSVNVELN